MDNNKGFTVKCNCCGKEISINSGSFYNGMCKTQDIKFSVDWAYQTDEIKCVCGNKLGSHN